jgi:hypothetical protein
MWSGSSNSNSGRKTTINLKAAAEKAATVVLPQYFRSATNVQGCTESIILAAHAESIILSVPPSESMILSNHHQLRV